MALPQLEAQFDLPATGQQHQRSAQAHQHDPYKIEYTEDATTFLAQRRATTHAAFFIPHLRPGMRVLDAGCGPGSITADLAALVRPAEVVGIDIEPKQIALAQAHAAERQLANLRLEVGDVTQLAFPDASFDAVFLHGVVEYVADPATVFTEVRRVLKAGGVMGARHGDWGGFLLAPPDPRVQQFFGLFQQFMAHNGGDPLCGRNQIGLVRQAGFTRTLVSASYDCWTTTPKAAHEVAQFLASYCTSAVFAEPLVQLGWVDHARLQDISSALRTWAEHEAAFAAEAWGEVLAWNV
ncbi:MAG: methyltransferase domain-containing protein [Chloroflexales bacterium]|nr:methyltransferase domain-containing protein [Chloroflexales bacterium]